MTNLTIILTFAGLIIWCSILTWKVVGMRDDRADNLITINDLIENIKMLNAVLEKEEQEREAHAEPTVF